jgi:hypothetical protein
VKLPAHSATLPGNDLLFIVPLDPACRARLAGHAPVTKRLAVHPVNNLFKKNGSTVRRARRSRAGAPCDVSSKLSPLPSSSSFDGLVPPVPHCEETE